MYSIKLIPKKEITNILPLLQELGKDINTEVLEERLEDMQSQNYECVGVYDQEDLIGISGMWFLTKYYVGKHVEPDNVYILPKYQGKGIGKSLINWILEYARSKGCIASELNCYIGNEVGQQFWQNQGYQLIAYHYQKKL